MKSLFINRIQFRILTVDNIKYGADVTFNKGVNIVYGPNSLGKTSILTGIIYALGGEKSLGIFKLSQNPFRPEFYDNIDGKNIKQSFVLLEISNGENAVTIARPIMGNKTDVSGVKKCKIDSFDQETDIEYLISSGEGVVTEGGFQKFLFDFLGLPIVEVPKYEGGTSKIYFENMIPLFFIEQRAGWSQIQARQVTRYGIRDVKKVVFEYMLGLDRFESHLIEIKKKEVQEKLRKEKVELNDKEEEIIVSVNGKADGEVLLVERGDIGRTSIHDAMHYLEEKYERGIAKLNELDSTDKEVKNQNSRLRGSLRREEHKLRKRINQINNLLSEIQGYEVYIKQIHQNKKKNKQLKKIDGLTLDLNINACPVCENQLDHPNEGECKLCHSELRRKISTPEQNLEFLEDEENSFKAVLNAKKLEYRKIQQQVSDSKIRVKQLEERIEHFIATYSGDSMAGLREKIAELDDLKEEKKRYSWASRKWSELNISRDRIRQLEKEKEELERKLKKTKASKRDYQILKSLIDNFRSNINELELFRDKQHIIDKIKIDEQDNYTPYLEEYDIYNIISSSDIVRIMLSYYLGLLQTSLDNKDDNKINYPNILILDEPRQQNLDNKSLKKFVQLIEEISGSEFQVLLTTFSHVESDREFYGKYISHEMTSEDDYLIKKMEW